MAWVKGQSGNLNGRPKEKPFGDVVRMELAAAGKDFQALREIARKLIDAAKNGEQWAIQMIADRLDGKPMQESTHNIIKRDATDWTIADLDAIIAADEAASDDRTEAQASGGTGSDIVH